MEKKPAPATNEVLYMMNLTLMNIREELEKNNNILGRIEEQITKR